MDHSARSVAVESRGFAPGLDVPAAARAWCADLLVDWGVGELAADVVLVVSELCTNAVLHGEGTVTVTLRRTGGGVEVEVGDEGGGTPEVRDPGADGATGGRGLLIVDAVASDWSVTTAPEGPTSVRALIRP